MSAPALDDAPASVLARVPDGYGVRTLTDDDVEALVDLDRVLFDADAWPESMFRDELAHPEWRRYWGLSSDEQPGRIVGYLGLQYSPRIADVQTIGVLAEHRRRGLADYLMNLAEDRATAWGAESMMLEVRVDNVGAIRLYEGHGFETIHTRPRYYSDGTDALIMARPVTRTAFPTGPATHHTEQKDTQS